MTQKGITVNHGEEWGFEDAAGDVGRGSREAETQTGGLFGTPTRKRRQVQSITRGENCPWDWFKKGGRKGRGTPLGKAE